MNEVFSYIFFIYAIFECFHKKVKAYYFRNLILKATVIYFGFNIK
jgi:hypothetical protein